MARGNIITTFSGSQNTHTNYGLVTFGWRERIRGKNLFFGESVTRWWWWWWCTSTTTPHHIECATLIFSPEIHLTLHFTADKVIWINSLQWINSKFDEHLLLRRHWVGPRCTYKFIRWTNQQSQRHQFNEMNSCERVIDDGEFQKFFIFQLTKSQRNRRRWIKRLICMLSMWNILGWHAEVDHIQPNINPYQFTNHNSLAQQQRFDSIQIHWKWKWKCQPNR